MNKERKQRNKQITQNKAKDKAPKHIRSKRLAKSLLFAKCPEFEQYIEVPWFKR
jgi:MFS superfamily sulfate permease-like transporter